MAFCSNCGGPLTAAPVSPSVPSVQAPVAAPVQGPPTPWGKILVIVLVVILLLGATVIGGVVYVGYRVKKKADEVLHATLRKKVSRLRRVTPNPATAAAPILRNLRISRTIRWPASWVQSAAAKALP